MKKIFSILFFLGLNSYTLASTYFLKGNDLVHDKALVIEHQNKKGAVLLFLSAKCPCSNSHIQEIKMLSHDFPDFSFVAIHSNIDETKEDSLKYFKDIQLPFPVLQDENTKLADQFKAFKTPHAFILRKDGTVAYQGGVSNSKDFKRSDQHYLRDALTDLHNGKPVRTTEGRTLGCSIARKL